MKEKYQNATSFCALEVRFGHLKIPHVTTITIYIWFWKSEKQFNGLMWIEPSISQNHSIDINCTLTIRQVLAIVLGTGTPGVRKILTLLSESHTSLRLYIFSIDFLSMAKSNLSFSRVLTIQLCHTLLISIIH